MNTSEVVSYATEEKCGADDWKARRMDGTWILSMCDGSILEIRVDK